MTFKSLHSSFIHSFIQRYIIQNQNQNQNHISYYDIMNSLLSNQSFKVNQTIDYLDSNKCLFQINQYHFQLTFSLSLPYSIEIIICDIESGEMTVLCGNGLYNELLELDISNIHFNEILDLSFGGRRWEGGELNGKPFGFGQEFSEEGNLVYEGFIFEGKKVCIGKEWNDDENNNCLMYEGGYWNGERCGKGISYDLNGDIDYDGEWRNNRPFNSKPLLSPYQTLIPPPPPYPTPIDDSPPPIINPTLILPPHISIRDYHQTLIPPPPPSPTPIIRPIPPPISTYVVIPE